MSSVAMSVTASAVREILKLTQGGSVISLAGGLPAEELFPLEDLAQAYARVFARGAHALQYGLTEGYMPLREVIASRMANKGMPVDNEDLLLTTGSQQAIDLVARVLIEPGDRIFVEDPTYLAALQIFKFHSAQIVPIATDRDGIEMDALRREMAFGLPKFVYVTPTFSNPTGRVWTRERREQLLSLCREFDVLVLEDDPYGDIAFDVGTLPPTLYAIDAQLGGDKQVIYTSTFSKTVVPAVRSGWVLAPKPVAAALVRAKQAADLHSSSIDQQALYELLTHFDIDAHIATVRDEYRHRMLILHGLLSDQQWSSVRWERPSGGMFLWLELPEHVDTVELLPAAVREGVAYVPGYEFYAGVPRRNTLRLNFSHSGPDSLQEGVRRLASALQPVLNEA